MKQSRRFLKSSLHLDKTPEGVEMPDRLHGPTLGIVHARNSAEASAPTLDQRHVRVYTELSRGSLPGLAR